MFDILSMMAAHYTKGGGLIYCSGQIGQDENGKLVGNVTAQTVSGRSIDGVHSLEGTGTQRLYMLHRNKF